MKLRVAGAAALAVLMLAGACTDKASPPVPSNAIPAGTPAEARYFFDHRQLVPTAPADLAGAIKTGLPTWSQSAGRKAPGEPALTLNLSLLYQGQGRDIVVLDVIPWKVGDTEKGPGAFFSKTKRYGLLLRSGERAAIEIPVVVQRVGPAATSPTEPGAPVVPPATDGTPRSLGGTGVFAFGLEAQGQPEPSSSTTGPRPNPSFTPIGPTPPPQKGGPFDPDAGVQVIVVAAYVGDGVPHDAFQQVSLVADAQFAATYSKFFRVEQGIAIPVDRLI